MTSFLFVCLLFLLSLQLTLEEGLSRRNWNLSFETYPSTIVYADSTETVVECLRNETLCPSPVRPVGSMTSVTACIQVDHGTLLDLSHMNQILRYDAETGSVTMQAGVTLADLHDYLLTKFRREISFQPEMGLATVGSLTVSTSKDSSVDGPGYFNALVQSIQYIDYRGQVRQLDRQKDRLEFQEFLCSWGLLGVVVEVTVETRPAQPILTRFLAHRKVANAQEAFRIMEESRQRADNLYFLLSPQEGVVVSLERYALENAPRQNLLSKLLNGFKISIIQRVAYFTIQHGVPYSDARRQLTLKNLGIFDTVAKEISYWYPMEVLHHRSEFVFRYNPTMSLDQDRLDFSLFFFSDITQLEQIFTETYDFTVDWYEKTGFAPSGFNMYFVHRTGEKLCGDYSGEEGISFALDPYYNDPDSVEWMEFVRALTARNLQYGVTVSLTQSRFLEPGQFQLYEGVAISMEKGSSSSTSSHSTKEGDRLWTPFYEQFVR